MSLLVKVFLWITQGAGSGLIKSWMDYLIKKQDTNALILTSSLTAELASRQIARDIRLATAGFWEMRVITFWIAFFMTSHLGLVWLDTITTNTRFEIEGWVVPALPEPIGEWQGAIILSFFGLYGLTKAGQGILTAVLTWLRR
jgi:hypothetical protein